jgi:hypothetical protein
MEHNPKGIRGLYEGYLVRPEPKILSLEEAISRFGFAHTLSLERVMRRIDLASEPLEYKHVMCLIGDYPERITDIESIRDNFFSAYRLATVKRTQKETCNGLEIATIGFTQSSPGEGNADGARSTGNYVATESLYRRLREISHVERYMGYSGFKLVLTEYGTGRALEALDSSELENFNGTYPNYYYLMTELGEGCWLLAMRQQDLKGYQVSRYQGAISINRKMPWLRTSTVDFSTIFHAMGDPLRTDRHFIACHMNQAPIVPVFDSESDAICWAEHEYSEAYRACNRLSEIFRRTELLAADIASLDKDIAPDKMHSHIGPGWEKLCN